MALSTSAKRTVRSFFHFGIAALSSIPALIPLVQHATAGTPLGDRFAVLAGALLVWSTTIAGLLNMVEAKFPKLFPAWLRDEMKTVPVVAGAKPEPAFEKLEEMIQRLPDPKE